MAKKKENIDQIFREGLKDFSQRPRPRAWDKLEAGLDADKKPRRRAIIWFSSVAATILLLILGYRMWNGTPTATYTPPIANEELPQNLRPELDTMEEKPFLIPEEDMGIPEPSESSPLVQENQKSISKPPSFQEDDPRRKSEKLPKELSPKEKNQDLLNPVEVPELKEDKNIRIAQNPDLPEEEKKPESEIYTVTVKVKLSSNSSSRLAAQNEKSKPKKKVWQAMKNLGKGDLGLDSLFNQDDRRLWASIGRK